MQISCTEQAGLQIWSKVLQNEFAQQIFGLYLQEVLRKNENITT